MQPQHKLDRLDTRTIPGDLSEIYCVMCIQNEMLRLPWVLEYHRNIGVDRFFIIDNGSTDGSTDYLLSQPDVHCFYTEDSYGESGFGISWTNLVLDHFCGGHWTLVIDADELFVYPHCETTSLHELSAYLDASGARTVYTRLLDMYSSGPLSLTAYTSGEPFLQACRHFDGEGYRIVQTPRLFPPYQIYGGVRERVFWSQQTPESGLPPVLTKVPFVKWRPGQQYLLSTHVMTPAPLADVSGVLLHFKFMDDFHDRAVQAVTTETQFDRSREYQAYAGMLQTDPQLSLYYEGSVEYRDSAQLVTLNIMACPPTFSSFVAGIEER